MTKLETQLHLEFLEAMRNTNYERARCILIRVKRNAKARKGVNYRC
jgi:hypothetical protein